MSTIKNVFLFAVAGLFATAAAGSETPRLVLQITVDQLRADMPRRIQQHWSDDGFGYLYGNGVEYADAIHAHANSETIVGHATLATGAYPAQHGMIGNVWFDRALGRLVYNIEDSNYHLLSANADVDQQSEIDPTQRAAKSDGRSPSAIRSSTIADEIAIASAGRAKIFGVSVKDRGAVAMAGHSGKAFWFSKQAGEFVTSNYYYPRYPDWVAGWNGQRKVSDYAGKSWKLLLEPDQYRFGDADDREYETDFPGYGRTFPHPYGEETGKYFTTLLTLSPAGDELTLDFAKALIAAERLGDDDVTDYLSVSFSSTDYVGHLFGPSSLESEDNLIRLDRTIGALLRFVDERVGLGHTLVVFSADHGAPEVPGFLSTLGIPAGYADFSGWPQEDVVARLRKRFGFGARLIQYFYPPYVYLNHSLIQENNLDQSEVEAQVAAELEKIPGVEQAIRSSNLESNRAAPTAINRAVRNNHDPHRSGDIFVIMAPNWFVNDFDGLVVAASHGSPWSYDTHVPVIFAGAGIEPQRVMRRVETVDIAATVAGVLGIKPPSASRGKILPEVKVNKVSGVARTGQPVAP